MNLNCFQLAPSTCMVIPEAVDENFIEYPFAT
jgi:hypothetical protein